MFFVIYLVTATFTVLNLFIAVIVNAMQEQVVEEQAQLTEMERSDTVRDAAILDEIRSLRHQIAALRRRMEG